MDKQAGIWDSFRAHFQRVFGSRPTDPDAERHFKAKSPDWGRFNERIVDKGFREAVSKDPRADARLRKFVRMQGRIREYRGPEQLVTSSQGDKRYSVQFHKDIGRYTCSCPDFKYKKGLTRGGECKHIRQVKREGTLKKAVVQSFGSEYAQIVDRDPVYAWMNDSAAARELRTERGRRWPTDDTIVDGRLRTSEDDVIPPESFAGKGTANPPRLPRTDP